MLDSAVDITDLDGEQIRRAWELLAPPPLRQQRWAVVVLDAGVALIPRRSRVSIDGEMAPTPGNLRRLRDDLQVDLLVACHSKTFAEILADAEPAALSSRDVVSQWLCYYRALRTRRGRDLWMDPPLLDELPSLSSDALRRAFELFIPNQTAISAFVFDEGTIVSSIIAVKGDDVIESISMSPAIADHLPASAIRAWNTQYRSFNDAIRQHRRPPAISVFTTAAAVRRIQTGPADQLIRELGERELIVDPMPPWLLGVVGGAQAAAVAQRGAATVSRLMPRRLRRAAEAAASVAKDQISRRGADPFAVLGFDPSRLWRHVQQLYRQGP